MRQFLIGQYGGFDEAKYRRDFKPEFYGIEACMFENEEDVRTLVEQSEAKGILVGIHFPLRSGGSPIRDALFMSKDDAVREDALERIERELEYVRQVKPEYVLFHYPKPVVLDDAVNWEQWRFADRSEYMFESEITEEQFVSGTERLFQWLTAAAERHDFIPVLEFDALNRYVYEGTAIEDLLAAYDKIKLCLDTGRLWQQQCIDPGFDSRAVIRKYGRFAHTVHLWNVQIKQRVENGHFPVLPDHRTEDGWAPIEHYLRIVREQNPNVKVMFEHRSDKIDDEQLERCYSWVHNLMNGDARHE
ncbi:sugar phosphate isomerase/epimerase family protein [Paenibacillus thermotolerans]|uniref:sugar phosphate isomerase/epimerase family protein n=1 Tax=Paenibacillus thermotolerans TaxID=3027807 RepID=UPI0023675A42|nr:MULTISPECIES: TIM barrel protein [unclassified Paenibacillus]